MKKFFRTAFVCLTVLILLVFLAACGKKSSAGDPQKIYVGLTGQIAPPINFLDANGNRAGYEYRLLDAIDERLEEYEFEYQFQEIRVVLMGLDNGRLDIGVNSFEWNEERAAKYLFSDDGYLDSTNYVTVKDTTTGISSLDDLQGKRVIVWPGSNQAYIVDQYNLKHPENPIEEILTDSMDIMLRSVDSGDADATILDKFNIRKFNAERDLNFKTVGEPVSESLCYFLFAKDRTGLRDAVNRAFKEMIESGQFKKLQEEILDGYFEELARSRRQG
ncbi:MAG: transporter substrate-binding domain-containing protein [Treponema sp.]|jgi:L-cystine transport system substrate-binding protein|nr:transporter substrate-binding domain-containing protein [Treponema sp.]